MKDIHKTSQREIDRLKKRFASRAYSIFWVRVGLVLLNAFLIFRSEWLGNWPDLIQWLASLVTFFTLAYAVTSLRFIESPKYGRWSQFITLNLDVFWLICLVLLTGGLFSPLMALTPIFTLLYALLFNNPYTIFPPLLSLPIITCLHPLFEGGNSIGQNELLVIMAYGLIHAIVLYVTAYNLSQEEKQNRDILGLERKLGKMAVVEERNRLARDIHDGVGGTLSAIIIQSEYLLTMPKLAETARHEVCEIKMSAEEAIEEVRRALTMMRGDFSLIPQLKNFCANFSARIRIPIDLRITGGSPELNHDTELTLFRILQECLNNVAKHSQAKKVEVTINFTNTDVSLRILDDGKGFDVLETKTAHYGLQNMKERARKIGAHFSIESNPTDGTCATFRASIA